MMPNIKYPSSRDENAFAYWYRLTSYISEPGYHIKTLVKHNVVDGSVPDLEARYWRVLQAKINFYEQHYDPAFSALVDVGEAHAMVSHEYQGSLDPWWLWRRSDTSLGPSIVFDWVTKPDNPINLEIGQRFYDVTRRANTVNKRVLRFETVLARMLWNWLDNHSPTTKGQTLALTINGRIYWYRSTYSHKAQRLGWEKLHWPGSVRLDVDLGNTVDGH